MSDKSNIEWTDATWNPVRGCTRVSPGCGGPGKAGGCYAEKIAARFSDPGQPFHGFAERNADGGRWTGKLALVEDKLLEPLRWKKPRKIFVNSMSDLFHENLPDDVIDRVFAVMALCPQHTFQVLTKRADRMRSYMSGENPLVRIHHAAAADVSGEAFGNLRKHGNVYSLYLDAPWPLPNVWLGVSAERQQEADERIPHLLQTPSAVRFVSVEPLLGPINLRQWIFDYGCGCGWGGQPLDYCNNCGWRGRAPGEVGEAKCPGCGEWLADYNACPECDGHDGDGMSFGPNHVWLSWVIVGGESGPNPRPMHPAWARSLRDQCAAADVPFFFKQWGEWAPHKPQAGGDLGGDVRADRVRIVHPTGQSDVEVSQATGGRNTIPGSRYMARVGKKTAGRLLDGREHSEFPRLAR